MVNLPASLWSPPNAKRSQYFSYGPYYLSLAPGKSIILSDAGTQNINKIYLPKSYYDDKNYFIYLNFELPIHTWYFTGGVLVKWLNCGSPGTKIHFAVNSKGRERRYHLDCGHYYHRHQLCAPIKSFFHIIPFLLPLFSECLLDGCVSVERWMPCRALEWMAVVPDTPTGSSLTNFSI